jgi:hypothetical protein
MSKPLVDYPDPEHVVVDYLADQLVETVGVGVPDTHTRTSPAHLQVAVDGQTWEHPIRTSALIRLTAWAPTRTEAKALCAEAVGLLLSQQQWPARPVSGPIPTRDPDTGTELATASLRVGMRTTPTP